jgi:hypothetical protein
VGWRELLDEAEAGIDGMFTPWILSLLEAASPRVIVEVGIEAGHTTVELLELASRCDGIVHAIDPSPQSEFDVTKLKRRYGDRLVFHQTTSLDALPHIDHPEAVLIDGDHNWYTVYNELKLLEKKALEHNRPFPLTLLHDVDWPYGRRDLYHDPDSIPEQFRQPFRKGGIVPGQEELSTTGGFNYERYLAVLENTPRNGVRTAIEDFLSETKLALGFQSVVGFYGTGILISEQQLQENEALRKQLQDLESTEWLHEQCGRIEQGRLGVEYLLDRTRLAASRRGLDEAEQADARPVFIIGPPESGGDVLTWALGQHPNLLPLEHSGWLAKFAANVHSTYVLRKGGAQLSLIGIRESEFFKTFANSINSLILRHEGYDSQFVKDVDERGPLLRYRSPADPKGRWINSSPEYSFHVYELFQLFPQAHFIYLLRDVREVANALMRLDRAASASRSAEFAYGEWLKTTHACVEAERAFGSRTVLRLRYADLLSDPERALRCCLAFIGESFSPHCLEPIQHFVEASSMVSERTPTEEAESEIVTEAIVLNDELLAQPDPDWDPDRALQVELGALQEWVELASLPIEGPMSQRGPATGYSNDRWVDGALTALFFAEEDVEKLTIEGDLPVATEGEQTTLFLTLNEDVFRETFPLGQSISWTVPCNVRHGEHADLRLRSSRIVSPSKEAIGLDERDLVLCLYRLIFSAQDELEGQVELATLPIDGPVSQRGPAAGFFEDLWVDRALTASFIAEEDIGTLTVQGDLPAATDGDRATLYLKVNEDEFRQNFPLGQEFSWTVPCRLRSQDEADLRLRSSRIVCPSEEGLGTDERHLVLRLNGLIFTPGEPDDRSEAL